MTDTRLAIALRVIPLLIVSTGVSAAEVEGSKVKIASPSAIILISLDTLRADMLGLYGYDEYPTSPFLDSLAAESVVFENAIVQEPRTLTSHMSLFTALLPHEHRLKLSRECGR